MKDSDIQEIADLFAACVQSSKPVPKNYRLFLISKSSFLRIYYSKVAFSSTADEFGFIRQLTLDRGQILGIFSRLEFLVNELMQSKLLGVNSPNAQSFEKILESVDFYSRIKILSDWGMLDSATNNLLMQTKQVRNGFAHSWTISEVKYKGENIESVFGQFKSDLEQIYKKLIETYVAETEKAGVEKVIASLKSELKASLASGQKKEWKFRAPKE